MSPETYAHINNYLLVFGAGVIVGALAMFLTRRR